MPNPRLTQIVAELPFEKKLAGIGSILMIISLFLPWYQDLDSFRTGDTFTGLTGPLYLVGFTFLVMASLTMIVMVMDYLDKKIPIFKIKASKVQMWSGIISFYLLFLVGSVYFHPAFGVNITLKQSGFGMFVAYTAAALMTIGGYLGGRGKAAVKAFEKETREQQSIQPVKQPVMETKVVHPMIERKPRENLRTMQPRQVVTEQPKVEQPTMDLETPASAPEPVAVAHGPAESSAIDSQAERKVQPYRMDL